MGLVSIFGCGTWKTIYRRNKHMYIERACFINIEMVLLNIFSCSMLREDSKEEVGAIKGKDIK